MTAVTRFLFSLCPILHSFFSQNPAFLYGLFVYFGAASALEGHFVICIPLLFFASLYAFSTEKEFRHQLILSFLVGLACYLYVSITVTLPPKEFTSIPGVATVEVTRISTDVRYGRTFFRLHLHTKSFRPDCGGFICTNIPCLLAWHQKAYRPHGGCLYEVEGVLKATEEGYSFKPLPTTDWKEKTSFFSLVELRYRFKGAVKCFLAKYLEPGDTRFFLEGVLLGEFQDSHLKATLKRFGLQHILVVSGFHFSLIMAFFLTLFRWLLTPKNALFALLAISTAFFLFIGPTPSVSRAYIAAFFGLLGALMQKQSTGVNLLGVGLCAVVLYDPVVTTELSFQLSFLATWAILLLYPLCRQAVFSFFPIYSLHTIASRSYLEQVIFVFSTFLLSSFSLMSAVTLLMLPASLFAFHTFPLLGLFYNTFFPFIVSIAMILVLLGGLFFWLPPLCAFLLGCGAYITDMLLVSVRMVPSWVDINLYSEGISVWVFVSYLVLVSVVAIAFLKRVQDARVKREISGWA